MNTTKTMPRSAYAGKLREFPDVAFAEEAAFQFRGRWAEFFGKRIGPEYGGRMILEIGCFDAVYLSRIAAEHPRTAFVGIDWKCKAIYDGAKQIADDGLKNVVLLRTRGHDLHKIFADAELDEIWIFHPDPCDRESELKNRLINERFLFDVHAVLKDSTAGLAIKTDHVGYYQSVLDLFGSSKAIQKQFDVPMKSMDYWSDAVAMSHTSKRLFTGRRTMFEDRFMKKRIPICYFEIRKR